MSLLNTDQKREKEHLARMLAMARDYARAKGFTGTFLIEPKPAWNPPNISTMWTLKP